MMEEVINLLTTVYNDIILIEGFKWKLAELERIEFYDSEEYFYRK